MDMHSEIAKVAYELYEKKGRTDGENLENWCEAEKVVMARHAGKAGAEKGKASAQTEKKPKKAVKGPEKGNK